MSGVQASPLAARRWPLGDQPIQANARLRFEDLSWRPRCGCKGPGAEAWLTDSGLRVPREANSAALSADGVLVARLASAEFLIEAVDGGYEQIAAMAQNLRSAPAEVYPVVRQDLVMSIAGPGSNTLLRQVCSVDFAALLAPGRVDAATVLLTSMIGVAVVAWPRATPAGIALTLWIDPSFAHYFCTTLLDIGAGVGGAFSNAAIGPHSASASLSDSLADKHGTEDIDHGA